MGKHLSEDEIKYVISASTSKAQQELHELQKSTNLLKKEEKDRRTQMIEMEAEGKKNTKEYQNLAAECKSYTSQISDNTKKMNEMRSKMDINVLTMNQLKKEASQLRSALNGTSKATNPQEYAKLESQLHKVTGRMAELNSNAKSFSDIAQSDITSGVFLGNIFSKIADKIGEAIASFKEFVAGGVEMAESADGVTRAFNRMNQPGLLDNLRKATKNTVNDVALMTAAVKAKDFRIPLQDLGKYLAFAQLKAQQTGQSVDYMTDSIVTGLGRQSPLILDNLGISAAEIGEKTKETGDFMKAVASIVENQLAAAGETYISAADRATQRTVKLQNQQKEMGDAMLPIAEKWSDAFGEMEISTVKLITWMVEHKKTTLLLSMAITGLAIAMKAGNMQLKEFIANTILAKTVTGAWSTMMTTFRGISLLFASAIATLQGNTLRASAAMRLFNNTCKTNIYILATTAILALAGAFVYYLSKLQPAFDLSEQMKTTFDNIRKVSENTRKILQDDMTDISKSTNSTVAESTARYKMLTKIINDNTETVDKRRKALDEIKKVAPAYHAQITTEGKLIKNNTDALTTYLSKLKETAIAQAILAKKTSIEQSEMNNQLDKESKKGNLRYVTQQAATMGVNLNTQKVVKVETPDKYGAQYGHATDTSYKVVDKATGKVVKGMENISMRLVKLQDIYDYRITGMQENDAVTRQNNQRNSQIDNYAKSKNIDLTKTSTDKSNSSSPGKTTGSDKVGSEQKASFANQRKEELAQEQKTYEESLQLQKDNLAKKKITEDEYNSQLLGLSAQHTSSVLTIEQKYTDKSEQLKIKDGNAKKRIILEQQANENKASNDYNDAQIQLRQQFYDALDKMESEGMTSSQLQEKEYKSKLAALEVTYKTSLSYAKENGENEKAVTAAYERNKEKITLDYTQKTEQERFQIRQQYGLTTQQELLDQELAQLKQHLNDGSMSQKEYEQEVLNTKDKYEQEKQQIRQQYGLTNQQDEYDMQLVQLKQALKSQKLTQEEYEKAVQNLKRDSYKKQFDYYSNLFSGAVSSLQQAEIDQVDAEYDVKLEAAKNNSEETTKLENEKAQKELDIKKKYADANFYVKASQIVADTATAIMQGYADLGPIGGSVAAVLMAATGAAQLASANAEREKVKNMTLAGSSTSSTVSRVAVGLEDGGNIDVVREQDGKVFKSSDYDPMKRGYVDHPTVIVGEGTTGHSKEWIASNAAVENPTVSPFLKLLDSHQQAGDIRTFDFTKYIKAQGYEKGGSVSTTTKMYPTSSDNTLLMQKMMVLLQQLHDEGIPASVALTDIDRAQQLRDKSRKIGSK